MVDEPKQYVFDSFALLAYFGNEPGAETVEQLLRQAQGETVTIHLSLVNLGECITSPSASVVPMLP